MLAKIKRSGNGFVIRVSREEMDRAGVKPNEYIQVDLRPIEIRPKLRPELQAIVDRNIARPEFRAAMEHLADA